MTNINEKTVTAFVLPIARVQQFQTKIQSSIKSTNAITQKKSVILPSQYLIHKISISMRTQHIPNTKT